MTNLLKNRIFLIVAGIIFLFIIINFIIPAKYLLNPMRNLVFRLTVPITGTFFKGGDRTQGFFGKLGEIRSLSDEKSALEKRNAELTIENTKLKEVAAENEALRQEIGLKQTMPSSELVLAQIIGRGPSNLSGSYLLNKGKNDGLETGMPVVSGQYLLGRLTEVESNFSRLTLIVDPSSVINVEVQESRANGILKGEAGFNLSIESVPQEQPLTIGQRIITSGLGGTMPKGLIVGAVAEIISSASEIFQSGRIKPAADFNHLEAVFIIKKY